MASFFSRLASDKGASGPAGWALALLRIGLGLGLLLGHGWPKLAEFSERSSTFADPLGVGPFWSLLAAIPAAFTMAVVVFVVQHGAVFGKAELAALYGLGFVVLIIGGGGNLSLGRALRS
ncbi:MAG: DoxX family protein [Fibrobacteria bacterium]|nr:DoxX family protein [Fibrobacteria bacterium]